MTNNRITKTITLYKPLGMTPLEAIRNFQKSNPKYQDQKLSYAGRLDPMAEGMLLILVGEENKKRKMYETLDKTYEIDILFGIKTDSYDILGIPQVIAPRLLTPTENSQLKNALVSLEGEHIQIYPEFSSKPLNGKPLYYWARKGLLKNIERPTRKIFIKNVTLFGQRHTSMTSLFDYAQKNIAKVKGDFRQQEIQSAWQNLSTNFPEGKFSILSLRISCSSGTYMRSVAHDLGEKLTTGAMAYSIKRVSIERKNEV